MSGDDFIFSQRLKYIYIVTDTLNIIECIYLSLLLIHIINVINEINIIIGTNIEDILSAICCCDGCRFVTTA